MDENKVRIIIREELRDFISTDRYTFHKVVQFLDGRNIQLGKTTGTKIGTETSQKLAFYGNTPVNQPETVADPTNQTSNYVQADVQSIVGKVNEIIDKLQELGLIA